MRKHTPHIAIIGTLLCAYLLLMPVSSVAIVYNLRVASHHPESHEAIRVLNRIKKKLADKTNGQLILTIYPNGELGDYQDVYEELIQGTIDLAHIAIPSKHDERIEMNFIPYLFENYNQITKVFSPGAFFFEKYKEIHKNQGVILLGIYAEGFIGFGTKTIPRFVSDAKIRKRELIRVPPIDVFRVTTEDMGFRTATIPYSELAEAIKIGMVEGWVGGTPELNYLSFRESIQYFIPYNSFIENTGYFISARIYETLPGIIQKAISQEFLEEALNSFTTCEKSDRLYLEKMKEYGITIIDLSDNQRRQIADHIRAKTWPKLSQKFGSEIMEGLKGDLAKE
jgi:TRAP-type C4-dicarboxylate transport system substrate-binding protein